MGAGSEWAVRCMLLAAWSASNNAGSEAFTFISRPPSSTAVAPSSSTSQRRSRAFSSPPSVARPPSPQHGPRRKSGRLYASSGIRQGRSTEVLSSRQRRVLASSCCDDQRRVASPCNGHLAGSRSSRRRWPSALGPLFAEDQGWLDALKGMSDEPALPLGPTKKVREAQSPGNGFVNALKTT